MILTDQIEFEVKTANGPIPVRLAIFGSNWPPPCYVYQRKHDGWYYAGQLNHMSDGWHLDDSALSPYMDQVLQNLEWYYGKHLV
jgi:hypothetical protein